MLTAASALSSNKEKGHNCFTWAKEKLHAIGDNNIQIKSSDMVEFIDKKVASISALTLTNTHYLPSKMLENKNSYASLWKNPLVIGGGVVLALGVAAVSMRASKSPTCNLL